jgi:hypothetical protein
MTDFYEQNFFIIKTLAWIRIWQQPESGFSESESETLQKAQEPVRYGEKVCLAEFELGTAVRYRVWIDGYRTGTHL